MKTKEYYVYALIDPRNKEYFYIGKGKGRRYNSHLKENIKDVKNIFKYSRIKEIEEENHQVQIEILFPNLTEHDALNLERIIIYKIGRKAFREGGLLNFVPGGNWSPGDSLFYETKPFIEFDLTLLDFVAQEKFLSIKKTSTIVHLDEIHPTYFIYKYNLEGTLISIDSLCCFLKDKNNIDIFFDLKEENLPVYCAGFIYAKKPIIDFYFSERLVSLNSHLVEPNFLKLIEENISTGKDFALELKQNGISRIKVDLTENLFKIETYFPNNKIQNIQYFVSGIPHGKWLEYYDNGNLKLIKEYNTNGKILSWEIYNETGILSLKNEYSDNGKTRKTWNYYNNGSVKFFDEINAEKGALRKFYYPNGELNYTYNNYNQDLEYSFFDQKGNLIEEFVNKKGYVRYNSRHEIIGVRNSKDMGFNDPYNVMKIYQTIDPPEKNDIVQKRITDENWKAYERYLSELEDKNE